MGARRDDIPSQQRLHIAQTVLAPQRPHGTSTRLAHTCAVSRQTIYPIAAQAKRVLQTRLTPGPHGPHPPTSTIVVDRNRLLRAVVVLAEAGVSQRDIVGCLAEVLDSNVSVGWLHATLAHVEHAAAVQTAAWQPTCGETLAGDAVFSHGAPNLLVIGNDSLFI